ncbi:hypothetical protein L0B53_01440 [Vibrio sp. SS-MA-C1-2]|uniref:hypothetical protein n=1 Tax=Vibrio sp. SS-MA-C1-2 TaxID=2908646 RepID=UPI001F484EA4|nr:hypothetical protein [Vibrio sp. SS-MA-C1-2]UJF17460.1 hypothetical protein L0B53_01440 [Vibrio sp. SS-MA-C1-2]
MKGVIGTIFLFLLFTNSTLAIELDMDKESYLKSISLLSGFQRSNSINSVFDESAPIIDKSYFFDQKVDEYELSANQTASTSQDKLTVQTSANEALNQLDLSIDQCLNRLDQSSKNMSNNHHLMRMSAKINNTSNDNQFEKGSHFSNNIDITNSIYRRFKF